MARILHPLLPVFALACILSATAHASLTWDRTHASIEMAPGEETASAAFTAKNEGAEPVRISRIKTSCGCTGSVVDNETLAPGESGEILAKFHKGNRRGTNESNLKVFLDQAAKPAATLRLTVDIPTLVDPAPRIVFWRSGSSQTKREVRVDLDPRYIGEITDIDYNPEKLEVTQKAPGDRSGEESDRTPALLLEIKPKSFNERLRETITIHARGNGGITEKAAVHVFVQP